MRITIFMCKTKKLLYPRNRTSSNTQNTDINTKTNKNIKNKLFYLQTNKQ